MSPASDSPARTRLTRLPVGLLLVRYGLGVVLVIAGIIVLIANPGGFGVDGFAMAAGSGLSMLMLNWLYRLGVQSNHERVEEEEARVFLAQHGRWPDEAPRAGSRSRRGQA